MNCSRVCICYKYTLCKNIAVLQAIEMSNSENNVVRDRFFLKEIVAGILIDKKIELLMSHKWK